MTDEFLLENGFHQFSRTPFDPPAVEACFQKCYADEIGKRYFITVRKFGALRHPYTGDAIDAAYEYDVQLYVGDERNALDLKFHSSWELADVERLMAEFWESGSFEYYETFE